jgi:hypothetical protein
MLIITDGDLDKADLQATKDTIVELAQHPVSIVIVGIKHNWEGAPVPDFTDMDMLDGDTGRIMGIWVWFAALTQFVLFRSACQRAKRKGHCSVC